MINVVLGDERITSGSEVVKSLREQGGINLKFFTRNSNDFIRRVDKCRPEIAVLDFMSPVAQGLAIVTRILKDYRVSVVVISDVADDDFVARLSELGVAYYLMKPFSGSQLIQKIRYVHEYHGNMFSQFYVHDRRFILQYLSEYFADLGIPPYLKGHRYLLDAVLLASQDNFWLNGITKRLYPAVARCNKTSASHVERTVRYAIDSAWTKGDLDKLMNLFPYSLDPEKGKPTNLAFIAKMADIINTNFQG